MKNMKKMTIAAAMVCCLGVAAVLWPAFAPAIFLISATGLAMFVLIRLLGWVLDNADAWEEKERKKLFKQMEEHKERIAKICREVPQEKFA